MNCPTFGCTAHIHTLDSIVHKLNKTNNELSYFGTNSYNHLHQPSTNANLHHRENYETFLQNSAEKRSKNDYFLLFFYWTHSERLITSQTGRKHPSLHDLTISTAQLFYPLFNCYVYGSILFEAGLYI